MTEARWFVSVLVVRSRVGMGGEPHTTVDLQYRLIHAVDAESAYNRAVELGRATALSYQNSAGEDVSWEFAGLHHLHELDDAELTDGTEVYSRLVRDDPSNLVVPKGKLSVFWAEANKGRIAQELLEDE